MLQDVLYVAAGSMLGGVCRYVVSAFLNAPTDPSAVALAKVGFPWSTLTVNVVGSLLLGLVSGLLAHSSGSVAAVRAFAVIGFCGGFTTFSTFSNDAFRMLESSQWQMFVAYVGTSLLAGIGAVMLGYVVSR